MEEFLQFLTPETRLDLKVLAVEQVLGKCLYKMFLMDLYHKVTLRTVYCVVCKKNITSNTICISSALFKNYPVYLIFSSFYEQYLLRHFRGEMKTSRT